MRRVLLAAATVFVMASGAAHATIITDPVGDFLGTYAGAHNADLDVTSFGVLYDPNASVFHLSATFAGAINPDVTTGFYVIGVNTGAPNPNTFAAIGAPGVIFNRVITIQKSGATNLGAGVIANIVGNAFNLDVALGLLAPTPAPFTPYQYGFNLWPRGGAPLSGNAAISDFAPDNAMITGVPEPRSWVMLLIGFGALGGLTRARRRSARLAALRA